MSEPFANLHASSLPTQPPLWDSSKWHSPARLRPWLLSDYDAPFWDLNLGKETKPPRIRWDREFPDGSCLLDPEHAELLAFAKHYLEILIEDPLELRYLDKISTALSRTRVLLVLIERLVVLGLPSFDRINPSQMDDILQDAVFGEPCLTGRKLRRECTKENAISVGAITAYFRVLKDVWEFSQAKFEDGEPLGLRGPLFDPFSSTRGYGSLAEKLGKPVGRTRTLSHRTALLYINHSIKWIVDHSTELLDLRDAAAKARKEIIAEKADGGRRQTKDELQISVATFALRFVTTGNLRKPSVDAAQVTRPQIAKVIECSMSTLYRNEAVQPVLDALETYAQSGRQQSAANRVVQEAEALLAKSKQRLREELTEGAIQRLTKERLRLPYSGSVTEPGSPWPIETIGSSAHGTASLEARLNNLWCACWIVITAFMADRLGEVTELRGDCLKLTPLGPSVEHHTYKIGGTEAGIRETKPCPAIVGEAIRVLARLGEGGSDAPAMRKVFAHQHRGGFGVPEDSSIRQRLFEFGLFIGLTDEETKRTHGLSPHELRRWFAMAYMWIGEEPDLNALRQHLSQIDLDMTARYVLESLAGSTAIANEQKSMTTYVISGMMLGTIAASGAFGRFLARLGLRLDVQSMTPERFEQVVESFRAKHALVLRPSPFGYCAYGPGRTAKAKCRMPGDTENGSGPNPDRRTETNCGGCYNFLNHNGFLFHWEFARQRFLKDLARPTLPVAWRKAAEEGLTISTQMVTQFRRERGLPALDDMEVLGNA
jgi:integrase